MLKIFGDNKTIFRSSPLKVLPPDSEVGQKFDTVERYKQHFKRLYQLSPVDLLAAKAYIETNLKH